MQVVRVCALACFTALPSTPWAGLMLAQNAAPQTLSLQQLEAQCASVSDGSCDVQITTPIHLALAGTEHLPRRLHFHVRAPWTITGGTLDFAGGTIDADPDKQVFFGSGHIVGLAFARPEWFAAPEGDSYPSIALRKAYEASDRWGTILLREHNYLSPFFDPESSCGGKALLIDSPRIIVGSRRPIPDSLTNPTRLIQGSIIRGEICATEALRAVHLGVDVGPLVVAHDFNGHETYGIQVTSAGALGKVRGTALEDVSVLTNGMETQHSVIVEGQRDANFNNLWIWTLGGTHGLVVKSFDSTVENFHCSGASADCLILKSDYATDHQGRASNDNVHGVFLSSLAHPGDTGGIMLDARWDSLQHLKIEDIHEDGLAYGIVGADSALHHLSDVDISDWTATDMRGPCLLLQGGSDVRLHAPVCSGPGVGPTTSFEYQSRQMSLKRYARILWTQLLTVLTTGTTQERSILTGMALLLGVALLSAGWTGRRLWKRVR